MKLNISLEDAKELRKRYNEPWRFYHNENHIINLIEKFTSLKHDKGLTEEELDTMIEAAYYHDVVYNPWSRTNEEDSVEFYKTSVPNPKDEVIEIILGTKEREKSEGKLSSIFWEVDNSILKSDIPTLMEYEKKIFKEFQFVDYSVYKEGRIDFLKTCLGKFDNDENLQFLITYLENFVPKIGFYPGSFNPMHIGHMKVIEQAEKIFDKVVIGIGENPDKDSKTVIEDVEKTIGGRQLEVYTGLTTDVISKLSESGKVTLIRGLRNGDDLAYENNQLEIMKDVKEVIDGNREVDVVYIPCDKKHDHISSTLIRKLMAAGYEDKLDDLEYLP
ncbi:MAG: Phosphopantetheine adenylyltransferase [uncultured marine phage]|uniref:Phosphopantetheine adenylyltransferase n=1 Tax=uncultured marine phage TaxID=707152 RepID=A0A8D9CAQ7_9VIRU|nr:MAG: Phosphopantetheine adenylyltransferase [uncultured marine phage]